MFRTYLFKNLGLLDIADLRSCTYILARSVSSQTLKKFYITSDFSSYDKRVFESCLRCESFSHNASPPGKDKKTPVSTQDVFEYNAAWCGVNQKPESFWARNKALLLALGLISLGAGYWLLQGLTSNSDDLPRPPKNTVKSPEDSEDIPVYVPYLIIGGGNASLHACNSIQLADPKAKILIISAESNYPYDRNRLTQQLQLTAGEDVIDQFFLQPKEPYVNVEDLMDLPAGIAVARGWEVAQIDVINQCVTLVDGIGVGYDKLLIATGCSPMSLPVFEESPKPIQDKIIFFHDVYDLDELEYKIECGAKEIVVVADDVIGSELAYYLAERGKIDDFAVYLITPEKRIMSDILPEYLSDDLSNRMLNDGIILKLGTLVQRISMKDNRFALMLSDGEKVNADAVIVSAGRKPNVKLAEASGLDIDSKLGGYVVDEQLLAAHNVWVAGDCVSVLPAAYDRQVRIQHNNLSELTGKVAGENMVGGEKEYTSKPTFWADFGSRIHCETHGCIDSTFDTVAVFVKEETSGGKCSPEKDERFQSGMIFYICRETIVGILLWNMPLSGEEANTVIAGKKKYTDIDTISKKLIDCSKALKKSNVP